MNKFIHLAYGFDGKGGAEALEGAAISQLIKDERLAWVHMDANHPDTKKWLETEADYLDPFIIDALLAEETRPRMTPVNDGVLLILRGVNLNENADPEDMVSIRLWVDKHRIISLRKRSLKAARDIEAKLLLGKGPKDAGEFICMLITQLFNRMEPVLIALDEATDDTEEQVLESGDNSLRESIVNIRKQAIIFRRYMSPQRDAIEQLRMSDISWLNEKHKRNLQESYNHVTRYVEDLDAIRERAQIVKDELANMLADRLNRNMYVLSVIAAIFLPLGFLTGLLGINIGGIPGTDNANAFWIFSGILVLTVVAQVIIFKKFKWF
ncbi:zinc transporter ZntB [Kiloniella laminariae]|uniref:zinc transporter ZntB n=1 Tax=Kiloniella laminariae TaxID=454162 RepID=UPI0003755664|nr:zinc transporter ZntB [Kiloniella laminariae]